MARASAMNATRGLTSTSAKKTMRRVTAMVVSVTSDRYCTATGPVGGPLPARLPTIRFEP
jgi:hypothetical protein